MNAFSLAAAASAPPDTLAPPLTSPAALPAQLRDAGWAAISAASLQALSGAAPATLQGWQALWHTLPPDPHLRDGGGYRRRLHGCFVVNSAAAAVVKNTASAVVGNTAPAVKDNNAAASVNDPAAAAADVQPVPHRAHWQPVAYNALHGGIQRWFEPLPPTLVTDPAWHGLLRSLAAIADGLRGPQPWYVEAHPFRIDTGGAGGIGRPTPEGAHRDGVDLVAVVLVQRHNVKGGETRVFDAHGPQGVRFTLSEPWSTLLLDDARVIHESTPIQPVDAAQPAWRDTLVLTFRSGGFQGPDATEPDASTNGDSSA